MRMFCSNPCVCQNVLILKERDAVVQFVLESLLVGYAVLEVTVWGDKEMGFSSIVINHSFDVYVRLY